VDIVWNGVTAKAFHSIAPERLLRERHQFLVVCIASRSRLAIP
jgi:hypothetical protein